MDGLKVRIDSGWSSLDGRAGVLIGNENGYCKVQVDGYQYPMLWPVHELEAACE